MGDLSMTPDLRELLGAIADDPRAQLLRVKSHQAAQEGLERNPKVSSSAPFLRKAERRLLELHREELGRLLYAYAHIVRMQVPENALRVHYQDLKVAAPTKAEIDHRARALLETKDAKEPEAKLLQRCLRSTSGIHPTEIIGAVLRTAPSDRAQVSLGADLCLEGHGGEADSVLRSFLGRGIGSRIDSFAWEALGMLAVQAGLPGDAAARYEAAVRSDATRVAPALFWLWFSLRAESLDSARRAATAIDRSISPEDSALAWFHGLGRGGARARGPRGPGRLALLIADQFGPASRRAIDGFT